MEKQYKYLYGPVLSWRLGKSLGIDLISTDIKQCTFNCVYCQLGERTNYTWDRKIFVPTQEIIDEIKTIPEDTKIDYITFSGMGEPTLAANIGEVARKIRTIRKEPLALLTNATLLGRSDVVEEIKDLAYVSVKCDVPNTKLLQMVNRPKQSFDTVLEVGKLITNIQKFRKQYNGIFAVQIMVVETSFPYLEHLVEIVRMLSPDRVELNTPLRPSNEQPVSNTMLTELKESFKKFNVVAVYDTWNRDTEVFSDHDTIKRRGRPW